MAPESPSGANGGNPFLDMIEALSNRHGQVDIHLDRMSLKFPFVKQPLEVNGTVTISVHLRDLTEKDRAAHVSRQLKTLAR